MNNNSDSSYDGSDEELFTYGDDTARELRFRSVRVESAPRSDHFQAFQQSTHFTVQQTAHFLKTTRINNSKCPCPPSFGMPKTTFNIIRPDYNSVIQSISDNLCNHENFDFGYFELDSMWKGKYLRGANSMELEVNLYQETEQHGKNDMYIVAVRKLSCDSAVNNMFMTLFNAMKTALCNDPTCGTVAPARKPFCIPSLSGMVKVSDEEFLQGVESIFKMCDGTSELPVQGVKALCDVSQKSAHYLELPAFQPKCVKLLEALLNEESEEVRQHAVMAVAAFAELDSYREAFLRSDVLPALFLLVENCQYETAQMRRTAAAVLALLCRTHPYSVRSELHQHGRCVDLNAWLQRVPCLQDARTRESAMVVKACLEDPTPLPESPDRHTEDAEQGMSSEEAAIFAMSH